MLRLNILNHKIFFHKGFSGLVHERMDVIEKILLYTFSCEKCYFQTHLFFFFTFLRSKHILQIWFNNKPARLYVEQRIKHPSQPIMIKQVLPSQPITIKQDLPSQPITIKQDLPSQPITIKLVLSSHPLTIKLFQPSQPFRSSQSNPIQSQSSMSHHPSQSRSSQSYHPSQSR